MRSGAASAAAWGRNPPAPRAVGSSAVSSLWLASSDPVCQSFRRCSLSRFGLRLPVRSSRPAVLLSKRQPLMTLILSNDDVEKLLTMPECIDVLEEAYVELAE